MGVIAVILTSLSPSGLGGNQGFSSGCNVVTSRGVFPLLIPIFGVINGVSGPGATKVGMY
jgi:hypothetical protein